MELRQLQQFLVLAETLNFHIAAERLHMTQPPLSISIRKLEEEIEAKLFARSTHGVQLTKVGHEVLEEAQQAMFHASEFKRIARSIVLGLSGQLRIGFVGSAKWSLLPRLLSPFREQYPNVVLKLHEKENAWILEQLETNTLDVGIVRVPFAWTTRIEYSTVENDVFVVALPAEHNLAKKKQIALQDLADEPFISYTTGKVPGLHAMTMLLFQEAGVTPKTSQEGTQVATLLCLVENGLGVALVPSRSMVHASKKIVFRKLKNASPLANIGLAIAHNPNYDTVAAKRFYELAIAHAE